MTVSFFYSKKHKEKLPSLQNLQEKYSMNTNNSYVML